MTEDEAVEMLAAAIERDGDVVAEQAMKAPRQRAEQAERERDEARAEAASYRTAYNEEREARKRAEADNAALLNLLRSGDMHRWEGRCPETEADTARDPDCPGCRLLSHDHPGAALLERMRALEEVVAACGAYLEFHGGQHEEDECPEDDTCQCPHLVHVNSAMSAAIGTVGTMVSRTHQWSRPDGDGVMVCERQGCNVRSAREGLVWQRRKGGHWRETKREAVPLCEVAP